MCIYSLDSSHFSRSSFTVGSARSFRPHPASPLTLFLANHIPSPHGSATRLLSINLASLSLSVIADTDAGLFIDTLPMRCWLSGGDAVVGSTVRGVAKVPFVVGMDGKVNITSGLEEGIEGNVVVLDVEDSGVALVVKSGHDTPHQLVRIMIGKVVYKVK